MVRIAKPYNKAPLPFTGQKRNFITQFRQVLTDNITGNGTGWTIIDVFGGSGLLAHNAKYIKPEATVIYNDFDGYAKRLQHIEDTNRLRRQLLALLGDYDYARKLTKSKKMAMLELIKNFDGFVDAQTLASWLLFSGNQIKNVKELPDKTLYNRIRRNDYETAQGYLDGLVITGVSYTVLLSQYVDKPKTLLILDPPYVSTKQESYALANYFGMIEFLTLMQFVRPPFLFFSSTRSEFIDYLNFLKTYSSSSFAVVDGFSKMSRFSSVNKDVRYEDNLIYKF